MKLKTDLVHFSGYFEPFMIYEQRKISLLWIIKGKFSLHPDPDWHEIGKFDANLHKNITERQAKKIMPFDKKWIKI